MSFWLTTYLWGPLASNKVHGDIDEIAFQKMIVIMKNSQENSSCYG